jgi:ABC-2 type transport system permease protein
MLIAVLGTPLLPAGLGALLVLLVARVAPVRRVREVLGLVAALFGTSCALIGNTASYWTRQLSNMDASLEGVLKTIQSFAALPVPSLVAGRGLVAAGQGSLLPALGLMVSFLLVTFGFFAGCVWLADRMYATGWLRMQGAGATKRTHPGASRSTITEAAPEQTRARSLLDRAAPFFAITLKDWRISPRDLRNFAQFLSPLFLIPLIYFQLFVTPGGGSGKTMAEMVNTFAPGAGLSNILLAGTILMSTIFVFSRIAQTGISMEGRSYWILKIAPISSRELLLGKFIGAMVPFTLLSTLLLVIAAIVRHFSLGGFFYGWFGILLLGAGMLAMAVGISVPWANLEWDDPRKMHSGWGGLIAFIGYILIGLLGGAFLALPYLAELFLPFIAPVAWLVGPFFAVGFTGLVAALSLSVGLSRLHKVGEA